MKIRLFGLILYLIVPALIGYFIGQWFGTFWQVVLIFPHIVGAVLLGSLFGVWLSRHYE